MTGGRPLEAGFGWRPHQKLLTTGFEPGAVVREITVRESTYGAFRGGDPREFHPDPENTPEELAAHAVACKESAPTAAAPSSCARREPFGLGSYEIEVEAIEVTHADGRVLW